MSNRRLRRPDGTCCTVYRLPLPEPDLEFGPVDPKLTVLRFDDAHGQAVLFLTSVGIHPVVGGGDFYGISSDYPGCCEKQKPSTRCRASSLWVRPAMVPLQRGEGQRARPGRYLAGAVVGCEMAAHHLNVVRMPQPASGQGFPDALRLQRSISVTWASSPRSLPRQAWPQQRSPFPRHYPGVGQSVN